MKQVFNWVLLSVLFCLLLFILFGGNNDTSTMEIGVGIFNVRLEGSERLILGGSVLLLIFFVLSKTLGVDLMKAVGLKQAK